MASRIRDRGFESRDNNFPQNQIIIFYFLVFPFYFSQFWSKTMWEYILKVWQYWICNGKGAKHFYFAKWLIPHIRAKQDKLRGYQAFYSRYNAFIEMKNDLAPDDKYYIRGKMNALWFWQHLGRTITLAVFDIPIVSSESQVLYSFIIKMKMDTPIFYFLIFR